MVSRLPVLGRAKPYLTGESDVCNYFEYFLHFICSLCGVFNRYFQRLTMVIYYVKGEYPEGCLPTFFLKKQSAELYAIQLYPKETPDQRYARIFSRNVEEN